MDCNENIVKKLRENRILNEREDYENMERDELIKRAQEGDRLAVDTLIKKYQWLIDTHSKKYFLDTGDQDDIKQYLTIALWDAIKSWNMSGDFDAYAGMLMKRKMTDVLRRENAEKVKISTKAAQLDAPAASDDEGGETTLGASLPSKDLNPEDAYIDNTGLQDIVNFLEHELTETERDVIRLYIKGYKMAKISEVTGLKYKTCENALMRAKNKLRDHLNNVRESKKLRESSESIFSDEEKQILRAALDQIDESRKIVK